MSFHDQHGLLEVLQGQGQEPGEHHRYNHNEEEAEH